MPNTIGGESQTLANRCRCEHASDTPRGMQTDIGSPLPETEVPKQGRDKPAYECPKRGRESILIGAITKISALFSSRESSPAEEEDSSN